MLVLSAVLLTAVLLPVPAADVEVVVTASRIEEESETVTAQVYVITREEIERQEADSVEEVLQLLPFVRVSSFSGLQSSVSMGGFGENGFGRTLILVDGRPVSRPDMQSVDWAQIPIESVDRIEIIRGPASSQYGDAAVAGVVNIITNRTEPYTLFLETSVDSELSNRQALTVSAGTERLDVSLSATRSVDLSSRERTDAESWSVSPRIEIVLTEWAKAAFFGTWIPSGYELPGGLTEEQFEDDPDQATNQGDELDNRYWDVGASFDFEAGDFSASLPVVYSVDSSEADFGSWPSYYDSAVSDLHIRPQASYDMFLADPWYTTISGGVDVRLSSLSVQYYTGEDREVETGDLEATRTTAGVWLRNKVSRDDRLVFDGGIRYELAALESETGNADERHDAFVYDAGVAWRTTEGLRLSLRYGKVFRYPFLDEQVSYSDGSINDDLNPESGHHFVADVEARFGDLGLSASPYLLLMEDEIMFVYTGVGPFLGENRNAGETHHYGVTFLASYDRERFVLSAGYSWDRAEFSSGGNEGNLIPLVPNHKVTGSGTLFLPADLSLISSVAYTSDFYPGGDDANDQDRVSGRTDWDAVLAWKPVFAEGLKVLGAVPEHPRRPDTDPRDLGMASHAGQDVRGGGLVAVLDRPLAAGVGGSLLLHAALLVALELFSGGGAAVPAEGETAAGGIRMREPLAVTLAAREPEIPRTPVRAALRSRAESVSPDASAAKGEPTSALQEAPLPAVPRTDPAGQGDQRERFSGGDPLPEPPRMMSPRMKQPALRRTWRPATPRRSARSARRGGLRREYPDDRAARADRGNPPAAVSDRREKAGLRRNGGDPPPGVAVRSDPEPRPGRIIGARDPGPRRPRSGTRGTVPPRNGERPPADASLLGKGRLRPVLIVPAIA